MGVRALVVVTLVALATRAARGGVTLDPELAELAAVVRDNCADDTGVDRALLTAVDGGADLPPDPTFKCYIKCTMEMGGMLDGGRVDVDAMLALMPPAMADKYSPIFHSCDTQLGADDCETAYLTQLCWQKTSKADYFLI